MFWFHTWKELSPANIPSSAKPMPAIALMRTDSILFHNTARSWTYRYFRERELIDLCLFYAVNEGRSNPVFQEVSVIRGLQFWKGTKVTAPEGSEVVKQGKADHSRPLFPASTFCLRTPRQQRSFQKQPEDASSRALWSRGGKVLMKGPHSHSFSFCLAAETLSS